MKVLIAEDDNTSRQLLERTLQKWGYEFVSCQDGAQAWEILQQDERPGLAVLDWMMPAMTGLEICRRVRAQDRSDYVYVIMLTSKDSRQNLLEGVEAGTDEYLTKPLDARELELRLRNGRRILNLQERLRLENQAKEEAIAALERSNEALRQFAYLASHDLQEPLRMVASYVGLLGQRYRGKLDPDADDFIRFATDGVARMRQLVRGLLRYAQVRASDRELEIVRCEAALNDALLNLDMAIKESGAEITADPLPSVTGDESQLAQLFQNLIGNSIGFRGDHRPQIRIGARREGAMWVLSVSDNGVGIPEKDIEAVFELFQRADTGDLREGVGIGLAVCREIVKRHGGRIWAESKLGQGATFYFTLPVVD